MRCRAWCSSERERGRSPFHPIDRLSQVYTKACSQKTVPTELIVLETQVQRIQNRLPFQTAEKMYTGEKQLEANEVQAEIEKESVLASRRDSVPLIFDHSYTERQSNLDRETKWLGDKARELHKKLAVLKRYQEDIEERTRILREKNLELMERNHQLAMGNRELQELVVEANSIRRDREEDLRRALEARDEFNWEDRVDDRKNSRDLPQHEP